MPGSGDDGFRRRYFHERAKVEAQEQAGDPVRPHVSEDARGRLMREIIAMSVVADNSRTRRRYFGQDIRDEADRVFGAHFGSFENAVVSFSNTEFLGLLEICVLYIWAHRQAYADVFKVNSILADDLSAYRLRDVGGDEFCEWQAQPIDNPHLHEEIVDRTFELTRVAAFASAQHDYAEAWKHYAKGDLDDAIVNAHKAVESAMKIAIKRVDPVVDCENKQTNQLVPMLLALDLLPSRLQNLVTGLNQIFMNSGSLRNSAGTGHGSVDLTSPEAVVALMALRLSGTLVSFLVERCEQLAPTNKNKK